MDFTTQEMIQALTCARLSPLTSKERRSSGRSVARISTLMSNRAQTTSSSYVVLKAPVHLDILITPKKGSTVTMN